MIFKLQNFQLIVNLHVYLGSINVPFGVLLKEMKEDFYNSLQKKLANQFEWPSLYLFKFIIPADNNKLALVEALFGTEVAVTTRQSSNNKYISITAKEIMISPEEIISVYKKAALIEGIISL